MKCSLRRLIIRHQNFDAKPINRVLIVGERPAGPMSRGRQYIPFLCTKNSSGWLNAQLDAANIPEADLVWLNAYDIADQPITKEEIEVLAPRQIVTLGGIADKLLQRYGLEHATFNHPSYWKRFRSTERYPLIRYLRKLTA